MPIDNAIAAPTAAFPPAALPSAVLVVEPVCAAVAVKFPLRLNTPPAPSDAVVVFAGSDNATAGATPTFPPLAPACVEVVITLLDVAVSVMFRTHRRHVVPDLRRRRGRRLVHRERRPHAHLAPRRRRVGRRRAHAAVRRGKVHVGRRAPASPTPPTGSPPANCCPSPGSKPANRPPPPCPRRRPPTTPWPRSCSCRPGCPRPARPSCCCCWSSWPTAQAARRDRVAAADVGRVRDIEDVDRHPHAHLELVRAVAAAPPLAASTLPPLPTAVTSTSLLLASPSTPPALIVALLATTRWPCWSRCSRRSPPPPPACRRWRRSAGPWAPILAGIGVLAAELTIDLILRRALTTVAAAVAAGPHGAGRGLRTATTLALTAFKLKPAARRDEPPHAARGRVRADRRTQSPPPPPPSRPPRCRPPCSSSNPCARPWP